MGKNSISPTWIVALTVFAIVMPIALCVLSGTGALLSMMGDATGAIALGRIALIGGILWGVDLVCLVLVLAVRAMQDGDRNEGP